MLRNVLCTVCRVVGRHIVERGKAQAANGAVQESKCSFLNVFPIRLTLKERSNKIDPHHHTAHLCSSPRLNHGSVNAPVPNHGAVVEHLQLKRILLKNGLVDILETRTSNEEEQNYHREHTLRNLAFDSIDGTSWGLSSTFTASNSISIYRTSTSVRSRS